MARGHLKFIEYLRSVDTLDFDMAVACVRVNYSIYDSFSFSSLVYTEFIIKKPLNEA